VENLAATARLLFMGVQIGLGAKLSTAEGLQQLFTGASTEQALSDAESLVRLSIMK
jgi:hypothetical protein